MDRLVKCVLREDDPGLFGVIKRHMTTLMVSAAVRRALGSSDNAATSIVKVTRGASQSDNWRAECIFCRLLLKSARRLHCNVAAAKRLQQSEPRGAAQLLTRVRRMHCRSLSLCRFCLYYVFAVLCSCQLIVRRCRVQAWMPARSICSSNAHAPRPAYARALLNLGSRLCAWGSTFRSGQQFVCLGEPPRWLIVGFSKPRALFAPLASLIRCVGTRW